LFLPLGLVKLKDANVPSIAAGVNILADLRGPVDPSNESLRRVSPAQIEVLEELLQGDRVFIHSLQVLLLPLQGLLVVLHHILVLGRLLRQQLRQLLSQACGLTKLLDNESMSLIYHTLVAARATDTHPLLSCTNLFKLVVGIGVFGDYVLIGDGEDPFALVTLLVLALMEVDAEGALGIIGHHLLCSKRYTQHGRQSSTDVVGSVGVVGNTQHNWSNHGLNRSFNPVDSCILDIVGLEDMENLWVSISAGFGSGGVTMDRNPDDDVPENIFPIFITGGEAHRQHSRDMNATFSVLQQRNNLGSNGAAPVGLEDRVEDSMSRLLRDSRVSVVGEDEGMRQEI
jgi:hypothetical protein